MSITTKESEKKIISEYVQLSNKAKILYKSKEYEEALELFTQCEKKCVNISLNWYFIRGYQLEIY